MRRLLSVSVLLLIAGCESSPAEPAAPPEPDFSVLVGEWEVRGRIANEQWFTRLGATVTIGEQVSGQTVGVVDDWIVYTARLPMQYSYTDTIWDQAMPRQLMLQGTGNGGTALEVTASIPRSGRGTQLLHLRMGWPLPRRPHFTDVMYLSTTELNPQILVGTIPAPGDSMGWRMQRR